jgi:hypothetical protein
LVLLRQKSIQPSNNTVWMFCFFLDQTWLDGLFWKIFFWKKVRIISIVYLVKYLGGDKAPCIFLEKNGLLGEIRKQILCVSNFCQKVQRKYFLRVFFTRSLFKFEYILSMIKIKAGVSCLGTFNAKNYPAVMIKI